MSVYIVLTADSYGGWLMAGAAARNTHCAVPPWWVTFYFGSCLKYLATVTLWTSA